MNRRNFLHGLSLAGAASAVPLSALAGGVGRSDGTAGKVVLLAQTGHAGADALTQSIAASLARAGVMPHTVAVAPDELSALPALAGELCRVPGRQIVGVLDDAAATIFLAVAGSCGAGYRLQAQHRVGAAGARHEVRASGLEGGLAWSERAAAWSGQVATLYADIVAGYPPRGPRLEHVADAMALAGGTSLVSFVINT